MTKKKDEVQATPEEVTENEKLPVKSEVIESEVVDVEEEKLIDEAVKFINEKATEVIYKGHEEIGNYILKEFYNDDTTKPYLKTPKKK